MRVGIVFHKDPLVPATGIDLVRLRAISKGLRERGIEVDVLANVEKEGELDGLVPVRRISSAGLSRYDLLKTCYHQSILLTEGYEGPIVSRIVRVVDELLPERDEPVRDTLLRCQELIGTRAAAVVLNNRENESRWRKLYGVDLRTVLVPTGCPSELPPTKGNPFTRDERVVLFLGSLAAPRMVSLLNETAERLAGIAEVHLVGLNKACMYGGGPDCILNRGILDHGELPEEAVWDFVRHAHVGLALAAGPDAFDNDVSKIFSYLRGGLPVVSEEPILTNHLIRETGHGRTFRFGDSDHLVSAVLELLENPPADKEPVIRFMALEHSWERRVDAYVRLFTEITSARQ